MKPARIEVPDPIRKEVAVYGKLVLCSLTPISYASTVAPITMAKTAENNPR
jgi:hypothetical protein